MCRLSIAAAAMFLTLASAVSAWPVLLGTRGPLVVFDDSTRVTSVQSCNTRCQEQQTDCALKCDQDADCIKGCRAAAEACAKQCIWGGRDAGVAAGRDAG
jgi:hypothetical protein